MRNIALEKVCIIVWKNECKFTFHFKGDSRTSLEMVVSRGAHPKVL